jgi:hypothetical protein
MAQYLSINKFSVSFCLFDRNSGGLTQQHTLPSRLPQRGSNATFLRTPPWQTSANACSGSVGAARVVGSVYGESLRLCWRVIDISPKVILALNQKQLVA